MLLVWEDNMKILNNTAAAAVVCNEINDSSAPNMVSTRENVMSNVTRVSDVPMKRYQMCNCGGQLHAAMVSRTNGFYDYRGVCPTCLTHEGVAFEYIVSGHAVAKTVEPAATLCTVCFSEHDGAYDMCKSCYTKSMSTRTRATCQVCRSQHEGLNNVCQYCAAIADVMGMTIKEAMYSSDVVMRGSRANLIHKLYGYSAVLNPSLMERDRNYSSVAFEAGRCGLNVSDVCDNFEQDMLNRTHEEYEPVADDFMSYDAPVRGITRDVLNTIKGMSTEELDMNLPADEHESKVYEESTYRRVSKEQRECNFEYYTKRAAAASTKVEREQLRAEVEQGIKNSMVTFEVADKDGEEGDMVEITVPVFFPTGQTSEFFGSLNAKREDDRAANLELYTDKLNAVSSYTELAALGQEVYVASKEAEVTFEVEEDGEMKSITASMLFPKGESKIFWAAYKEKKEVYVLESNDKVAAISEGIRKLSSAVELKKAKQKIYNASLPLAGKKELWALCDERIVFLAIA